MQRIRVVLNGILFIINYEAYKIKKYTCRVKNKIITIIIIVRMLYNILKGI
jgi:hypothetical protein